MNETHQQMAVGHARIRLIDLARGVALVAMAIYHFGWDLEFFGYAERGMTAVGGWKLFARAIASSFIFLAGVSLVLAHHPVIRWRAFWRRLGVIIAAAAAITAATYVATPGSFIFFGILHSIAAGSLLGLAFLRLPPVLTILVAILFIAAPVFLTSPLFDMPALWWVGLSADRPTSNDYVPVFPWFGAFLLGLAAARIGKAQGWFERMRRVKPRADAVAQPLEFAGRHSLAVYLIHQPVLITLVYLTTLVAPPDMRAGYTRDCVRQCALSADRATCETFCGCVVEGMVAQNLFDGVLTGEIDVAADPRVTEIIGLCRPGAAPE